LLRSDADEASTFAPYSLFRVMVDLIGGKSSVHVQGLSRSAFDAAINQKGRVRTRASSVAGASGPRDFGRGIDAATSQPMRRKP
jgi:hypothetical protein